MFSLYSLVLFIVSVHCPGSATTEDSVSRSGYLCECLTWWTVSGCCCCWGHLSMGGESVLFLNRSADYTVVFYSSTFLLWFHKKWCGIGGHRQSALFSCWAGNLFESEGLNVNQSVQWIKSSQVNSPECKHDCCVTTINLIRVHLIGHLSDLWPLTVVTHFLSFHKTIRQEFRGFCCRCTLHSDIVFQQLRRTDGHVGPGVWFQSSDWFRCPQVNCSLCSAVTIRTLPVWSLQTTAVILLLEEKITWLWCGICLGRSLLNKCEHTWIVDGYCSCVCSVWFRWI